MDKTAIRNFAIEARKILMKSAITEAGFYGITKEECKAPIQKGSDFEVYETLAGTENRIFGDDIKRRANLVSAIKEQGFEQVIEETAYTWFNRIIAIRFMEVNNYLPSRVRVLSSETGSGTPDIVNQADTVELNLTSDELDRIQTAKNENKYDEAFRLLFVKQCNELNSILPGLFEKTDDYMELLLKLPYTSDGVVRMLVDTIPEDNFNVDTEGQVEIIGWMYQFYNTELKDDTFEKIKKNIKVIKERIPAATQLFTPDWIVKYMVENSIGRVWIEHLLALDSSRTEKEIASEYGWKYYLPEAVQETEVGTQLVDIRLSYKELKPQDIKCIDPCMGSGHILVYMFDILMDIYKSEGFSEREAVFDILEKNIHGMDIDRRAYQLSYFALMMKARGYNRIFFRGHENSEGVRVQVEPEVYAIEESNLINRDHLKYFGVGMSTVDKEKTMSEMTLLLNQLDDAKEYGSILKLGEFNWTELERFVRDYDFGGQMDLGMVGIDVTRNRLCYLIKQARVMSAKYVSVVTNPPYMGSKNINVKLLDYIQKEYPEGKADIYGAFLMKYTDDNLLNNGTIGLITPYVWLYLSSFTGLRELLLERTQIVSLVQLEYNAFEVACVPVCTYVLRKGHLDYKGRYIQLAQFKGWENQEPRTLAAINDFSLNYCFETRQEKFKLIPESPIAYWIDDSMYKAFEEAEPLKKYGEPRQGMATADNNRFMRVWHEVDIANIKFNCKPGDETNVKWYPHSKGGSIRRWYGNNSFIINWKNNGKEIREFKKAVVRNPDYYFKKGITWSDLTVSWFTARMVPNGFTFDSCGPTFFSFDEDKLRYICGYLNSTVFQEFLNISCQGMHYSNGIIATLPIMFGNPEEIKEIEKLVDENIEISKSDWDESETSWDFKAPYIVRNCEDGVIEHAVNQYLNVHEECSNRLIANEARINDIFVKIFGMENVNISKGICPSTLSDTDEKTCIIRLISYAVGCMFGRFSLDQDGIVCAGKDFDITKYSSFEPDQDAIIPITDEKYLDDDIVELLCNWVKVAFGEEHFEKNITYIANVVGKKGGNYQEKLRNYFVDNFFADHCGIYSITGSGKRPIYWLFDSGKNNGFKCLIYLHRYSRDTVGVIRSDYVSKIQTAIETALKNSDYVIQTSGSAVDKAQASKRRDKYIKQLNEIKTYYQALSHIALQRIDLDLDDGVKANHAKFQGIEVVNEGEKKQVIDLLAKI